MVVTLLGGPADLQRHTVEELPYYRVAVMPEGHDFATPKRLAAPLELRCRTALYRVERVDRHVWIGVFVDER
ncbi:hypothetical protein [Lysobacter sp. CA199]|uniref:hypothetical protein n=1 Tax=Lysobacter sp. CA199 TaxID=3455608 RepID=UPI003F8D022C